MSKVFNLFLVVAIAALAMAPMLSFSMLAFGSDDSGSLEWRFNVTGLVGRPLNLTLAELKMMPRTTEYAVLYCVDFPGVVVMQGNWSGVRLSYLLDQAGINTEAVKIALNASDGYSTDLSVARGMQDDVLVAYEKDGVPLTEVLRLVVPDSWGYKWISQLRSIELVDYNFLGRWESRGYSDEANISMSGSPRNAVPYQPVFPAPSQSSVTPSATPKPVLTPSGTQSTSPFSTPSPKLLTPSPSASPVATAAPENNPAATTQAQVPFTSRDFTLETVFAVVVVAFGVLGVWVIRKRRNR